MVEARDIIAKAVAVARCGKGAPVDPIDNEAAHAAIAALTAAGWTLAPPGSRVVPDGGVDAETVERCAEVADVIGDEYDARATGARLTSESIDSLRAAESAANRIAAALRALAKAKP